MVVALALGLYPMSVDAAPAPEAEAIRVAVDTSSLTEDDGKRLRELVGAELIREVEVGGFAITEKNVRTTLRVRIEYLDQEDLEYAIHYDIQHDDELITDVPWIACVTCVDAALIRKIQEGLPAALERIREIEEEPALPPETADPKTPAIAPIGGLGIAGVVVAGLGLGTMIAGGVELGRGVVIEGGAEQTRTRIDHRTPGAALLGVGSAALVAGAILLGVDLGLRAKRRKQAAGAQTLVLPIIGPEQVGLGLVRNF
ncbi:MAG: hypothetical protein HC927_04615 [Deltaproteobacteria bacterium]|nr:hypothetical protein [Deltaproteobacteria bacterium]